MTKYVHAPVFCPEHGLFPSGFFAWPAGVPQTSILLGNVECCPKCGRPCQIIPGVYETLPDSFRLLIDRSISKEALVAIGAIAARLHKREISLDQAQEAAERVKPGAGKLFDIANWGDQAQATLAAAIIGAVAVVTAAAVTSRPSGNSSQEVRIEKIVEEIPQTMPRPKPIVSGRFLNTITATPKPKPKQRR